MGRGGGGGERKRHAFMPQGRVGFSPGPDARTADGRTGVPNLPLNLPSARAGCEPGHLPIVQQGSTRPSPTDRNYPLPNAFDCRLVVSFLSFDQGSTYLSLEAQGTDLRTKYLL